MEQSSDAALRQRTYGNFRRPESVGLGNLGLLGTLLVFGGLIVLVILMMISRWAAAVWAAAVSIVLLTLMVRDQHHRSGWQRLAARVGWARTKRSGGHVYRSGTLSRTQWGSCQLPGLLAQSRLHQSEDSYARPFALLEMPQVGHFSITIRVDPDGASLVDQEQIDLWVAGWGQWLAMLGQQPGLEAASVTVETAPDTGYRLRREVDGRVADDAPDLAKEMLRQVARDYPEGSAEIRAWVTLTFSSPGGKRRGWEDMARDLGSRLPSLTQDLGATGAGAATPVTAQELCEIVRVAYDPASAALLDEVRASGHDPDLDWRDVGPTAAEAGWDRYRHDGATSQTWMMTSAPRGEVFSNVLARLVSVSREVTRKRVTIIYRPLDFAAAARTVETDRRVADFRAGQTNTPSARAVSAQKAAVATATEEASGAGLVDFGMLITATVTDADGLADAAAAIESGSASARLKIRPAHGSQDSAFAAALPLGLVLPAHLRVPSEVRNAL